MGCEFVNPNCLHPVFILGYLALLMIIMPILMVPGTAITKLLAIRFNNEKVLLFCAQHAALHTAGRSLCGRCWYQSEREDETGTG